MLKTWSYRNWVEFEFEFITQKLTNTTQLDN
jgi:hypothetical protein